MVCVSMKIMMKKNFVKSCESQKYVIFSWLLLNIKLICLKIRKRSIFWQLSGKFLNRNKEVLIIVRWSQKKDDWKTNTGLLQTERARQVEVVSTQIILQIDPVHIFYFLFDQTTLHSVFITVRNIKIAYFLSVTNPIFIAALILFTRIEQMWMVIWKLHVQGRKSSAEHSKNLRWGAPLENIVSFRNNVCIVILKVLLLFFILS